MDDTSFDLLCRGLSATESKLFRKILKEWCSGEEDSFPVQLALLTRAQWLAAAEIPLILQKNVTALEAKMAEHHKQQTALMITLGRAGDDKIKAFEETVAVHTEAMEKVAAKSHEHLEETEKYAREIRKQMEYGLRESDRITKAFIDERHRLEEARRDYERSMEWREVASNFFALIVAAVGGALIALYYCHH
jgi:predicted DNA-binding WGR domain protein